MATLSTSCVGAVPLIDLGADRDSVFGTSDGSVIRLGSARDYLSVAGPVSVHGGVGIDVIRATGPGVVRVWGEDGDDYLRITLSDDPRALVDGGTDTGDRLDIFLPRGIGPGRVAVDLATPAIALPGQPTTTVQWSGIEAYILNFYFPRLALRLTGTQARDVVAVRGSAITADLLGGDDVLDAYARTEDAVPDSLRVHLGEGNDRLRWFADAPASGDLGGGDDWARLAGGNDVVRGGDGNDEINGRGGADILYGGIGTDALYGDTGRDHLYGGLGSDLLRGFYGDDFLDGGDGTDDGDGGAGTDQCVALETSVDCEG